MTRVEIAAARGQHLGGIDDRAAAERHDHLGRGRRRAVAPAGLARSAKSGLATMLSMVTTGAPAAAAICAASSWKAARS